MENSKRSKCVKTQPAFSASQKEYIGKHEKYKFKNANKTKDFK